MDGSGEGSRHSEVLRNYTLGRTIGIGAFGKVKIAQHKLTGRRVAVKIINCHKMTSMEVEKAKRELKILKLLIHPHVIRLYEVIHTPTEIYAVMEYCEYGELFDYIAQKDRLQEAEACQIFQQIIYGVGYCHRNKIAHRDLKPENLLLDSKHNVKVADFGLSNIMRDGHFLKTSCGSPHYASPEIVSGKQYAGPEVDVWSCGVILYSLLCGSHPFDDPSMCNLFIKIENGIYTLPAHLSELAKDLIPRMLDVDPMMRITIPEIEEHEWFQIRLPRSLAAPPPETSQQTEMIDEEILRDVVMLGLNEDHICESLHNRLQNEATVAYYLLLDSKVFETSGYLGPDCQASKDTNLIELARMESASNSSIRQCLPGSGDVHSNEWQPVHSVETNWVPGLESHAPPREVMVEVLQALEMLNARWKNNGHYNMKCRWSSQDHALSQVNNSFRGDSMTTDTDDANGRLPAVIKFEMQLYKSRDKYILDLQRVSGPPLLFLDFCAKFLTTLEVL